MAHLTLEEVAGVRLDENSIKAIPPFEGMSLLPARDIKYPGLRDGDDLEAVTAYLQGKTIRVNRAKYDKELPYHTEKEFYSAYNAIHAMYYYCLGAWIINPFMTKIPRGVEKGGLVYELFRAATMLADVGTGLRAFPQLLEGKATVQGLGM